MTLQVITNQGLLKGPPSSVYDRAPSTVDIQNTAVETSMYQKVIQGGDMGTSKSLRLTMLGDFLHNNGAGDTATFRFYFGGVQQMAVVNQFNSELNAARIPWKMVVHLANLGAANSQFMQGEWFLRRPGAGTGAATGIGGDQTAMTWSDLGITTLGTVDTTANQTLNVTVQWSAGSANNSWRQRYAVLELL